MSGCKNAEKGTVVYMDNGYMIHKSRVEMGVMKRNWGLYVLRLFCLCTVDKLYAYFTRSRAALR